MAGGTIAFLHALYMVSALAGPVQERRPIPVSESALEQKTGEIISLQRGQTFQLPGSKHSITYNGLKEGHLHYDDCTPVGYSRTMCAPSFHSIQSGIFELSGISVGSGRYRTFSYDIIRANQDELVLKERHKKN
jgi:hypothetical protein